MKTSVPDMKNKTLSIRLITKLSLTFLVLVMLIGAAYVFITIYFTNKYMEESSQRLHSNVANHLIQEKFQNADPFLQDGSVNKALFGDIMHDMMAVNQSIEVFLLDKKGNISYSVVLDHDNPNEPLKSVDLAPVEKFIRSNGSEYILGDDPRNPGQKKIFSAAAFKQNGIEGYIYIILAGREFEKVVESRSGSYFLRMGLGASVLTMIFSGLIGLISVWFLTKNLREIVKQVRRFQDGDLSARVENPLNNNLSVLAVSFNEMADTIVQNMEEIRSVDNLRRELIANVSHDLRTPLAIMQGYTETLQMKGKSLKEQEVEQYLSIIHNSSEKLSRLITQLFEYSKLEARQIAPDKEPFAITDLAYDVHAKYSVMAIQQNIDLQLEIPEDLPLVFADISLVERAIQNLMDNAMKFTPKGGKVTMKIEPDNRTVMISIHDTGPGIPEEEQSYIFERFRQVESKKKNSGSGLGLAIVKKILEIHDTTIEVISKPKHGTTFTFSLPAYPEVAIHN